MAALAFAKSAVGVGDVQRARTLIEAARDLPDPDRSLIDSNKKTDSPQILFV